MGWLRRKDEAVLGRIPEVRGRGRLFLGLLSAPGNAGLTLPIEILGMMAAAPGEAEWFALALLADVPGHLLLLLPLRYLSRRPRPEAPSPWIRKWGAWNRWSFPSAHAMRSWTVALLLSRAYPRAGGLFLGLAMVVTLARLPLRRHWPGDVLAGSLLGIVWAALLVWLFPRGLAPQILLPRSFSTL